MRKIIFIFLCVALFGCELFNEHKIVIDLTQNLPCVEMLTNLRTISNKDNISKEDLNYIANIYTESRHYILTDVSDKEIRCNNENDDIFTENEMGILKHKINTYCQINYWDKVKKLEENTCDDENLKKGCLKDFSDMYVMPYGTRKYGVIVSANVFSRQFFVYDSRDYYDEQEFQYDDYWYSYIGNYTDVTQKLPSFKRTNQKISKSNNEITENNKCLWIDKIGIENARNGS